MATKKTPLSLFLIIILFLLFATTATRTTAITTRTLDTVLALLRTNSHALFANAIATSDLLFDLLALPSLTLLAPPDPHLFALDMTSLSPLSYTSSLRCHVIPNSSLTHLFIPPLHTVPHDNSSSHDSNGSLVLHTLLPSRELHVTRDPSSGVLTVDGVEIVLPRLYYSRQISVFRLSGILPPENVAAGGSSPLAAPSLSPIGQTPHMMVSPPVASSPTPVPVSYAAPPLGDQIIIVDSPISTMTSPIMAPSGSTAAGPGSAAGRLIARDNVGDRHRTVVVREEGNQYVEKCGPLDGGKKMQCAATDDNINNGKEHVSFQKPDYAL